MTAMPDTPALRLVLDTNTVMALWFFEDPRLARLREAVERGRFVLIARPDTLEELRRVLAYPQFEASAERQIAIAADYRRRCAAPPPGPVRPATLPLCRDRDDQKFLEVARDGAATHLVSRDKALLRLNRHRLVRPLFAILTPESFCSSGLPDPAGGSVALTPGRTPGDVHGGSFRAGDSL